MDQWTQTSIKSGGGLGSESEPSAGSTSANAIAYNNNNRSNTTETNKHVNNTKTNKGGGGGGGQAKENYRLFPSKTHLGFRTSSFSSSSKHDVILGTTKNKNGGGGSHGNNEEGEESWITRAKTAYNNKKNTGHNNSNNNNNNNNNRGISRNARQNNNNNNSNTHAWGTSMNSNTKQYHAAKNISVISRDGNDRIISNNNNNQHNKNDGDDNFKNETGSISNSHNNCHNDSSAKNNKRISKSSKGGKSLEISVTLGTNGAQDCHQERIAYHNNNNGDNHHGGDINDHHHHHNHQYHHHHHINDIHGDDNDDKNNDNNDDDKVVGRHKTLQFFSPRFDPGPRRAQTFHQRISSSANSRKLGQLPASSGPHPAPYSAPARHCDACALDYVRQCLQPTNRSLSRLLSKQEYDDMDEDSTSPAITYHEPLQMHHGDGNTEPNQIYLLMDAHGMKASYQRRYNREPVSLRTVSLPRKGRIKLTALPYELEDPAYFDDKREAAEKRDLVAQYKEQLMGPALPNPSPDGSLIRNRSILKQVKSDVKRLEREKEQEVGVMQAMEGNGVMSLVEDVLKYEMYEVPNINSNLQNFVNKVQPMPADYHDNNSTITGSDTNHGNTSRNSNTSTTTTSTTNDNRDADIYRESTNGHDDTPSSPSGQSKISVLEQKKKSMQYASPLSPTYYENKTISDHKNTNNHHTIHFSHQPHHHKQHTNITAIKNQFSANKKSEEELFLGIGTPRSLPDIHSSPNNNNSYSAEKNSSQITITTPRKAFEDVIRKMEASNSSQYNGNDNNYNDNRSNTTTINNQTNNGQFSHQPPDRPAMWYNLSDSNHHHHHHHHHHHNTFTPNKSTPPPPPTTNTLCTDELSLHRIVKNAQKITSQQLKSHNKLHRQNTKQSTITVLGLGGN